MKRLFKNIINLFQKAEPFETSGKYWEERYKKGGNSGTGSYDKLAEFKADVINSFIAQNNISSVIEFGCGDGNQLKYFNIKSYTGFDVSDTAIEICSEKYKGDSSKMFKNISSYAGEKADLSMSLDVIYHIVEDNVYENYMKNLFNSANDFVIIYSSNVDNEAYGKETSPHVKHRQFTNWIEQNRTDYELLQHIPNKYPYNGDGVGTSEADFFLFRKTR